MSMWKEFMAFQRVNRSDRGSALVELSVTLPLLLGLLFGAADFGRVFYAAMGLTQAVTAGVQYGAQSMAYSLDSAGMQNVAAAAAADIPGFTATASRSCTCWNSATLTETTKDTCAPTCASQSMLRVYVTVSGSRTFDTLVQFPGIPQTVVLTRSATRRAQ